MNKKILAFICDGKNFLALRNNPKNPVHGGDFWFTVTGSLSDGETWEDAVRREIKEETNLDVQEVFDLNWGSIYSWHGQDHQEKNFIAFVKKSNIQLSKEHIEFDWLKLENFISKIRWDDNKEILMKVLKKALSRKLHFKTYNIKDYRK